MPKEPTESKPISSFLWHTSKGEFLDPKQMATRHLFYTLRMIWNHVAPEPYKFKPYRRYYFSSFYTTEYMVKAVKALSAELAQRDDIEDYQLSVIRKIAIYTKEIEYGKLQGRHTGFKT